MCVLCLLRTPAFCYKYAAPRVVHPRELSKALRWACSEAVLYCKIVTAHHTVKGTQCINFSLNDEVSSPFAQRDLLQQPH